MYYGGCGNGEILCTASSQVAQVAKEPQVVQVAQVAQVLCQMRPYVSPMRYTRLPISSVFSLF